MTGMFRTDINNARRQSEAMYSTEARCIRFDCLFRQKTINSRTGAKTAAIHPIPSRAGSAYSLITVVRTTDNSAQCIHALTESGDMAGKTEECFYLRNNEFQLPACAGISRLVKTGSYLYGMKQDVILKRFSAG